MNAEELLHLIISHVDRYATHRGYIERARTHAHKFSDAVVEKVVLDHEIKSSEVADSILPLVPKLEDALQGLTDERPGLEKQAADVDKTLAGQPDAALQEAALRALIGESAETPVAEVHVVEAAPREPARVEVAPALRRPTED